MNILIVYAHPEPQSFNGAMRDTAVSVLTATGHTVVVSDLYSLGFESAGGPDDFLEPDDPTRFRYQLEQVHATRKGLFKPELKTEMDKLLAADFVLFQFPLWWFSLPAILKGWVDRVFAMGFSYDMGRAYETGMFPEKRAMLALTTGAPEASYGPHGKNGDINQTLLHINRGMLHFIGMKVLPPFVAYGAARATPEQRLLYLDQFRERLLAIEFTEPMKFWPVIEPTKA